MLSSMVGHIVWQRSLYVVSEGGYLDTVSGRATSARCKDDWPSVALVLTTACTPVVDYSTDWKSCKGVVVWFHACGQLQYGLANHSLIFSLVLVYYSTLISYVYNCAQWQRRTPPA